MFTNKCVHPVHFTHLYQLLKTLAGNKYISKCRLFGDMYKPYTIHHNNHKSAKLISADEKSRSDNRAREAERSPRDSSKPPMTLRGPDSRPSNSMTSRLRSKNSEASSHLTLYHQSHTRNFYNVKNGC